jgi:hypothetical protein
MEDHIAGLVSSVVNGQLYKKPDFTVDLVKKFVSGPKTYTLEDAHKEWNRYVNYRRGLDLLKARESYITHKNKAQLEEDFMVAYYEASRLRKE